jgi:hypothetical protein
LLEKLTFSCAPESVMRWQDFEDFRNKKAAPKGRKKHPQIKR